MNRAARVAIVVSITTVARIAYGQCEREWLPGSGVPGVAGTVTAFCSHGVGSEARLFVGGGFTLAGSTAARGVAVWDGSVWQGTGSGLAAADGSLHVSSLVSYDGRVIVGGRFHTAGGLPASNIASWSNGQWAGLGEGLFRPVHALAVFNGELYATMSAPSEHVPATPAIVRWTGSTWQDIAPAGVLDSNGIHSATGMAVFNGSLAVAYRADDELRHERVALWNGESWSPLPANPGIEVRILTEHGGQLFCAGSRIEPTNVMNVRKWTGAEWALIGNDTTIQNDSSSIVAMASFGGLLMIAADFQWYSGWEYDLLGWDGSEFAIYPPVDRSILCLGSADGRLIAGGNFSKSGSIGLGGIAEFDEGWQAMGVGTNGSVQNILQIGGQVHVCGSFETITGVSAAGLARWDGRTWHGFGSGLGNVQSVVEHDGALVAVGQSLHRGVLVSARNNVARWDGTSWQAMGGGVGTAASSVSQGVVYNEDLYVCGSFSALPGVGTAHNVARWNGVQWSAIQSDGLPVGINNRVASVVEYHGELVFGGAFTSPTPFVGRYDGTTWRPMGLEGQSGRVEALCIHNGELYLGGFFNERHDDPDSSIYGVARWDGTEWRTVGQGLGVFPRIVRMISTPHGLLVCGDNLRIHGGVVGWMVLWDGVRWSDQGVGDAAVFSMFSDAAGLIVGGAFTEIGGVVSSKLAEFRIPLDLSRDGTVGVPDIFAFIAGWFDLNPRADWNLDGRIDIADVFDFLRDWLAGCP